jgi:hypothetical protein
MNDMNQFSSDQDVKFSIPPWMGALGGPTGVATSQGRAYSMCNSYAKRRARFVAYSERNSDAVMTSWIEKPNKRGKLPTCDLGRHHLSPCILAVGQFVVAAVSARRKLLNQKPAARKGATKIKPCHDLVLS